MEDLVFYLCCPSCKKRQCIGKNISDTTKVVCALVDALDTPSVAELAKEGLRGIADNVSVILKFIYMHHRHQIYLWNNEDFDESPLLWADQWSNEVPSWHDIQQLAPIDVEKRLSAEISRLRIENQRLVLQNHDLSVQLDNDPASIKQLQEELRQYVEDNGSVLITKETVQPNPVRVSGLE